MISDASLFLANGDGRDVLDDPVVVDAEAQAHPVTALHVPGVKVVSH